MEKKARPKTTSPKKGAKKPRRKKKPGGTISREAVLAVLLTGALILAAALLLGAVFFFVLPEKAPPEPASLPVAAEPPPEIPVTPPPRSSAPPAADPGPKPAAAPVQTRPSVPSAADPGSKPAAVQPRPSAPPAADPGARPAAAPVQTRPSVPSAADPGPKPAAVQTRPSAPPAADPGSKPAAAPVQTRPSAPPAASRPVNTAPVSVPPVQAPERVPAGGGRVEQPPEPPPKSRGTLILVIDDAGNNLRELEPFLRFPGPLTIAVLPGLPHSAEAARRIRAAGKEVFLHQPMEALGGQNPGPGAVYAGMSPAEIRAIIERNLAEIGPVAGMNNHQGSRITGDEKLMETVLALCREQGIYFLDSRTTAETAVPAAARRMGIKIGERDVFLDNVQERASIIGYVENGVSLAERKGSAVMIGHTWTPELAPILGELYPALLARGYSFSTFSRFMKGAGP